MSHYKYTSYHNPRPPKSQQLGYNLERLNFLAQPKDRSAKFLPDKPSPYWLDYILDPKPHKMRGAEELMRYYQQFYDRLPRLEALSRPKSSHSILVNRRVKSAVPEFSCVRMPMSKYKTLPLLDEGGDRGDNDNNNNNNRGDTAVPTPIRHHLIKPSDSTTRLKPTAKSKRHFGDD
ncbi:Histidinol dehydrogenase [Folsomia candida]|uniref:Histidinol dehydrogenase n=1 Tax=Folsomia candida TaxID=158441 RepID=A0A226EGJ8_FOLCA|nr:Histidinol dehydrogenase [Folsomia candida]